MNLQIQGLSPQQCAIADQLWTATSADAITALMLVFGRAQVKVVMEMMTLAALDQIEPDLEAVANYLRKF